MSDRLNAISPLDGRYGNAVKNLSPFFSESALMRYRLKVEIEYLIALGNKKSVENLSSLPKDEQTRLRKIYLNFNSANAEKVKEIELTTNHDVKAIEYYIQSKAKKALHPWIHFALTSEDVNNLSYSLMWQDGLRQVYLPVLQSVNTKLKKLAQKYKKASMLALTHGQPATPTTFGKELAVFCARLDRQIDHIKSHKLIDELDRFMKFPKKDPHGESIPSAEGEYVLTPKLTLSSLMEGQFCQLIAVNDGSVNFLRYVSNIGLVLSSEIEILEIREFDNSMRICFDNKEETITKKFADNVFVKIIDK
mgnify:CR=1 FL=1